MEHIPFQLSESEFKRLNDQHPRGKGSALIGNRAEAIVRYYFDRTCSDCQFRTPRNGADLEVVFSTDVPSLFLEIKGTEDASIAWQKLKVSSKQSYGMLVNEKIPLYRVTGVFEQSPTIYVLICGEDFELVPEPRWSIKRLNKEAGLQQSTTLQSQTDEKNAGHRNSKYSSLTNYLSSQSADEITFKISDAEEVLGFPLPRSGKQYQAFWANQTNTANRPWAKAWQDAGFYVESLRLSGEDGWVRFKRGKK